MSEKCFYFIDLSDEEIRRLFVEFDNISMTSLLK